ncbi:hypothetical protein Tco_1436109 [Tanacetum coccineum]
MVNEVTEVSDRMKALIRAMVAATEPTTIQSDVLKAKMLTDEAIRNGSWKKNTEKIGNGESIVGMEILGIITKDLGLRGHFPQSLTLLGKSTRVPHPNVQTATITIYPRCLIVCVRTVIALGSLPRIAGWGQFVKTSYYCSDKLSAYKFQNKLSAYKFKIQSCRKLFLRKLTFVSEWSFEEFLCEHLSGGIECPDRIRVHAACP